MRFFFLAMQGMAFRGEVEDLSSNENPGNFLALLAMLAENDSVYNAICTSLELEMQLTCHPDRKIR